MNNPEATTRPLEPSRIQVRITFIISIGMQVLTILVMGLIAVDAVQWMEMPFLGVLIENTMMVNAIGPAEAGSWEGVNAGLAFQERIVGVNGKAIGDVQEYIRALRTHEIGEFVSLRVQSQEGVERDVEVRTQSFPLADRLNLWVFPYLVGVIYLVCGLWVLSLRRADVSGFAFSILTASVAICVGALLDLNTTNRLTYLWTLSLGLAGGAMIHFALIFPQEARWVRKWPVVQWLGYGMAVLVAAFVFPTLFDHENPYAYILRWSLAFIYLGSAVVIFLGMMVFRRLRSPSPIVRQQATVILWGSIGSFLPITVWFGINVFGPGNVPFSPSLVLPLILFPMSVAYAILRYRWINTDYLFSRAVLYALLTVLAVGGYALLVSGASLVLGEMVTADNPLVVGLMVFVLAVLMNPVRVRLQGLIDRGFFRGQGVYQERIQEFSSEITPAMELGEIVQLLRRTIGANLSPGRTHIFVLDSIRDQYIAMPDESGKASSDIQFGVNSPLPQLLSRDNTSIYLPEAGNWIPALEAEKARVRLLGAQLFVPLPGRAGQVIGFLALTQQTTGEPYTNLDLNLLDAICDQAAMAVERAQVVADLERRINETNVLIRIAQGINITLRFDDILELIFAQSTRIVPAKDFWIMLYDRESNLYRYAFYLEDDLRLLEHESRPLPSGIDLAQEVIRDGQPIVTEDYDYESRQRGIVPRIKGLHAWTGVPLNAGSESIGAMSLGSRDPSVVYASDQVEFLQAIADQAAGAIIKARLLDDSERRARQLNLLNEVARNLTSTLDLPSLLEQILDNAIEIIGCEAGTLFLVDDESGELIFEVVKGPVAGELKGKRLEPGTGHVGRSVESGKAAIVNQVRQTSEWARKPDQQTGFETRDLLLVPMFAQDQVIGVIEVINRRDGLPFTMEDQEFLLAFSSQAAIALENARLYTLTDQQLAERVDELSVMQRIDRDLNTSLDIDRAMRITLEWAMRRSGAQAGLVGAVVDGGLRVMAEQGYTHELDEYRDSLLPVELPGIRQAMADEQTQQYKRSEVMAEANGKFSLLENARNQMVIPIRREEQVIGLLMLESSQEEPWAEDAQGFLSRLTDHAAIAIANAQLFVQVQEADVAKSEFVSFVSHELKTPMTSIRGYTDLLLAGAVGPVNEAQANFLATVKSNVNRMATLVSDLADVSRIESGRLKLEFMALDLQSVVDEVVRSQTHGLDEKGQQLVLELPKGLAPVWADRVRTIQVLTNLLSNANKYTPEKGVVTIRATQSVNKWDPEGVEDVILVEVADTGIGMTAEDQAQVFTKFFRSADPKARETPGTGLGLNITRNLVEMQGGKIWFESEYGKGTTFFFTVPVSQE